MDNCKTICPQSFYLGAYKERIRQKRGRLKIMFPDERLVVGCIGVKPITRRQILDSSKLKEFADDNFKFDENGRKLSKRVENTVGKGEIARYERFLLFPQCFQKACFPGASKGVIVWEWVNTSLKALGHIMAVDYAYVFPGFLTPVQTLQQR